MDNKIKKLEELVELFKSNSITKEEYEFLKTELLNDKSEKIDDRNAKPKIEIKNIQETQPQYEHKKETRNNYQYSYNKSLIIFFLVCFGVIALLVNIAFGTFNKKIDPLTEHIENIDDLSINGNSASFTYNVGFMYTLSYCGLANNIWSILKKYPNVNSIAIAVIQETEDKYGNKNKKQTPINIDQNWIDEHNVRKFNDADKFCVYATENSIFINVWVPTSNYVN